MVKLYEKIAWFLSIILTVSIIFYAFHVTAPPKRSAVTNTTILSEGKIFLPLPQKVSKLTVEESILLRRSIRDYTDDPINIVDLAMILWAAYGITEPTHGFRASPSAGATYPLELYVVAGEGGVLIADRVLKAGVYKYVPHSHTLLLIGEGDRRTSLREAALGQEWVGEAPISLVICAVFERTTAVYGERGKTRYVPMEAGHAGQNVYLMATALGYGVVVVGAFHDDSVSRVINAKPEEKPLYIVPIGVPKIPSYTSFEDIWEYIESRRG